MNVTLAFFTSRQNPRFAWWVDSLCRQTPPAELAAMQIVFVDAKLWGIGPEVAARYLRAAGKFPLADPQWHDWRRREELTAVVAGRFDYLHIPPKPSAWQGPFRWTDKDWFAASNARNTAIIVAERPYLVCCDDLSCLSPMWIDQVRHAATGYIVCGAYKKLLEMNVVHGRLESFKENPAGVDTRWDRGSDTGIVPWSGAGLFGCSFGAPVELLTAVDGFDYYCDGQGAEDYDLGIRLERAAGTGRTFYNRNMLTWESEEAHTEEPTLPRDSKMVPFDRLPDSLKGEYPNGLMSDHVMLQSVMRETGRTLPLGRATPHSLAGLRDQWQREKLTPIPTEPAMDWRDGTPLTPPAPTLPPELTEEIDL